VCARGSRRCPSAAFRGRCLQNSTISARRMKLNLGQAGGPPTSRPAAGAPLDGPVLLQRFYFCSTTRTPTREGDPPELIIAIQGAEIDEDESQSTLNVLRPGTDPVPPGLPGRITTTTTSTTPRSTPRTSASTPLTSCPLSRCDRGPAQWRRQVPLNVTNPTPRPTKLTNPAVADLLISVSTNSVSLP